MDNVINIQTYKPLTRYTPGSLKELWTISYPLMLSLLSISLMTFCDRLILAHYKTEAMNAVLTISMVYYIFQAATMSVASIAEVFVGQYNGAGKINKLGEPVWQMIWFAGFSFLLFWPVGLIMGPYFLPEKYLSLGVPYFKWLMLFGPVTVTSVAVSAFFIGQGRVKLVTYTTIFSNLINLGLDLILVFGFEPIISSQGTRGAALATGIASSIEAGILLLIFLNRHHRLTFGTADWHFKWQAFWGCLRIGFPPAIGFTVEIFAWAVLLQFISRLDNKFLTVYAIGQSVFILVGFLNEGHEKGIVALASNFIGAKQRQFLPKLFRSGLKLQFLMTLIIFIPLVLYPDPLIKAFLSKKVGHVDYELIKHFSIISLWFVGLYFLFDGLTWIFSGFLTAAGHTKFIMVVNSITVWVFALVPIYIAIQYFKASPSSVWILMVLYSIINALCFYWRYRRLQGERDNKILGSHH